MKFSTKGNQNCVSGTEVERVNGIRNVSSRFLMKLFGQFQNHVLKQRNYIKCVRDAKAMERDENTIMTRHGRTGKQF